MMPRLRSLLVPLTLVWVIGCSEDLTTSPKHIPTGIARAEIAATCDGLQEALDNANADDVITIAEGSVCVGHYDLPSVQIVLQTSSPGAATLDGRGLDEDYQILSGRDVGNTVIRNLTFRNGVSPVSGGAIALTGNSSPTISNSTFLDNSAQLHGGAVSFDGTSSATIENSTFLGNHAGGGGGAVFIRDMLAYPPAEPGAEIALRDNIFGSATSPNTAVERGGAVSVITFSGVSATGNRFSNNTGLSGGGFYFQADHGTVTGNTFTGNAVTGSGGGALIVRIPTGEESPTPAVFSFDGNVIKNNSAAVAVCKVELCETSGGGVFLSRVAATGANNTISGNSATLGGGILVDRSELRLGSSTISSNTATTAGGGIYAVNLSRLFLNNSTISSNVSAEGGGLFMRHSPTELLNVTVADNRALTGTGGGLFSDPAAEGGASTTALKNTIVARNAGSGGTPGNCGGEMPGSDGHNLEDANTCGLNSVSGDGDLVNANPVLGPLADNGGPTFTHALGAGSAAIDAADNIGCPAVDQRGQTRPKDGNGDGVAVCDIGSFESDAAVVPPPTVTGLKTKQLKINFGSHGGENAIDWSGDVAFAGGGTINPVTEPVTIRLTSGGATVFTTTIAPGNFVREPDGSFRYRSPKGASPEIDVRFKPRATGGWEFKIGVDGVSVTVLNRSAIDATLSVGAKSASQSLPLTDKGKRVEYKAP